MGAFNPIFVHYAFQEFPSRRKPASLGIDPALETLQNLGGHWLVLRAAD